MMVSTAAVHATERIPSALQVSPEAISATQVYMRVILSAAGYPTTSAPCRGGAPARDSHR
jgi:hypothetical protein